MIKARIENDELNYIDHIFQKIKEDLTKRKFAMNDSIKGSIKEIIKPINLLTLIVIGSVFCSNLFADDGYRLWLRYDRLSDTQKLLEYKDLIAQIVVQGDSPTIQALKNEITTGLNSMLGVSMSLSSDVSLDGAVLVGTPKSSGLIAGLRLDDKLRKLGNEGFIILSTIVNKKKCTVIAANTDIGLLYGAFHFLHLIQTRKNISKLLVTSVPKVQHRLLNHWDNLDGSVERGYAGSSLWKWHELPEYKSPRYKDYARANASIGINGAALTNVNANALVLTEEYLVKVAALAEVFRPYGIRVYLTARFSAPVEIGGLQTADPLAPEVVVWWKQKVDEIYKYIPDFGGFLVKANSEGQPGPQNYGRTHAEGANMLADALAPHNGIVMWRAFVYDNNIPEDRAKQAYNEFTPLDGKFRENVLVQVKNGPIDFQPREPFHPLFGAMPQTPLMMEFQITQEYLGQGLCLTYLAPLYKECLDCDTYAKGKGSYVSKLIDGTLHNYKVTGMAGVSNVGSDRNWCGHPFAQANWFAFGRLAWDHSLSPEELAEEWIRMTFSNDEMIIRPILSMMLSSREAGVNHRTPLGLHHLMAWHHHYGPGPWINKGRADWTSVYYHKADSVGLGFDRTATGSNAVSQYFPPVSERFGNIDSCPENLLLWFHHVDWSHKMKSGRSLWDELCYKYYSGVDSVRQTQKTWNLLEGKIDQERFEHVKALLKIQLRDAIRWRNACVLYFQTFSKLPIPVDLEKPSEALDYYKKIDLKYLPGS